MITIELMFYYLLWSRNTWKKNTGTASDYKFFFENNINNNENTTTKIQKWSATNRFYPFMTKFYIKTSINVYIFV